MRVPKVTGLEALLLKKGKKPTAKQAKLRSRLRYLSENNLAGKVGENTTYYGRPGARWCGNDA